MHPAKFADKVARRLHGMINEERTKRGKNPLRGRTPVIEAAEDHSRVMARRDAVLNSLFTGVSGEKIVA